MIKKLCALALVASLSGCASILNFDHYRDGPRIYGGTRLDASGHLWSDDAIGYIDLPFSFVMDTVLLPVYLVFEFFR